MSGNVEFIGTLDPRRFAATLQHVEEWLAQQEAEQVVADVVCVSSSAILPRSLE